MRMTDVYLRLLCCPVCHADLAFSGTEPPAIDCSGCGRRYPIVDDLPILLAERAILPAENDLPLSGDTAEKV